ncbi:MAG: DNA mismatch repair protein MutL [Firmicutes bacterium HGW-Firmicutes-8]|nr:MAG: DNA mismatch repair protein MutL [Firmicutes bacterium HGW-Firmicutes-8]
MGNIILLDEHTANKIAAGEVIERPASVVKELIENSIDAGSTRIEVSITDGGLAEITVSDNGFGMDARDAVLALERHATSKISRASDLESIQTLGFRGEALPSIASVSKVNLKTKIKESLSGIELVIEGGKILKESETGCPPGTAIRVSELFYNTPARQKHMKGPAAEAGHISDVVNKFAMGYPNISFQLTSSGRVVLKTSGSGRLLEVIANIYGPNTAKDMLPIDTQNEEGAVFGYLGKPFLTRSGSTHQTIYINGRYIRSRLITKAVENAYHGMLMIARHPVFVINIRTSPEEVDVNVHPAKTEVRLARTGALEEFITRAVKVVLTGNRLIPTGNIGPAKVANVPQESSKQEEWKIPYPQVFPAGRVCEVPLGSEYTPPKEFAAEALPETPGIQVPVEFPDLRPIGQIECTYIVAQGSDGMYLIDQHAAHERILYEKYMEKPDAFIASEQLLFPVTLDLTHREAQLLNDTIIVFTDLGFVVEHFGGESFILRGIPAGAGKDGGKEIFLDLLDYFSQNRYTISNKALREKFLITMACRNAIKANNKLGLPEMESLLAMLAQAEQPYTCPHGRPTMIHFSGYDLEKKFKRVL